MPHGETHPACSVISGTAHTSGVLTCTGPHARFLKLAAHVNLTSNGTQTPPIPVQDSVLWRLYGTLAHPTITKHT